MKNIDFGRPLANSGESAPSNCASAPSNRALEDFWTLTWETKKQRKKRKAKKCRQKVLIALLVITNSVLGNVNSVSALQIKLIDSDPTSIRNILDKFQQFVQEERLSIDNPNALKLDPTKVILAVDHDVRAYFLNEGAASENQLGFTATDGVTSQAALAFDNVFCHIRNLECQLPSEDCPVRDEAK